MISGLNLWQSHSGAAHQVEDDTPSLEGLCRKAPVFTVVNSRSFKQIKRPRSLW